MNAEDERLDKLSVSAKRSGASDGTHTRAAKSFGADIVTSPSIPSGYTYLPQGNIHGDWRSYGPECDNENNRLGACVNLSFSNDSKADESLINANSDLYEFRRASVYLDLSMSELHHTVNVHNPASAECVDAAISSTGYKSDIHMNVMPPMCGTATGYPIKAHGAEAKRFKITTSPMDGKLSSSENSTSALPCVDNIGATRNQSGIYTGPFLIRPPQKVDGSFLTLGIGNGREIRSNNFNPREFASKLEDTASLHCNSSHVGQNLQNPLSLAELAGSSARIQSNSGGFPRSSCIVPPSMSMFDGGEHIGNTSTRPQSNQFLSFQTPQTNAQPICSAEYNNFISYPSPSPLPFRSPPAHFSGQSVPEKQVHSRHNFKNVPSESSENHPSIWYRGSSFNHAQLGGLIPPPEGRGTKSSSRVRSQPRAGNSTSLAGGTREEVVMLGSSSVHPVGYLGTSQDVRSVHSLSAPQRIGFPVPNWGTFHSSVAGPFPKRLGVQPNDFPTVQITNDNFQMLPVRPPFVFRPPINVHPAPTSLPPKHIPFSPALSSGQQLHGMPARFGQVPPVAKFEGRPQASPVISHPSLKRPATENSPVIPSAQRRKILPPPTTHHSTSYKTPTIPAPIAATVPTPVPHVKCQGSEEPLVLTGHKCHLCKRDLSLTAEGPAYQPPNPPAVAVLPCGHTFHDHCLQIITPGDQSKTPPCIPCAIGET